MEDCPQAPIDPPDEGKMECRVCGSRFPVLRGCGLCDVDPLCLECMEKHLTKDHMAMLVEELTDVVSAADLGPDPDRRHDEED